MGCREMPGRVTVIAFDGDDTLWHNERWFSVTRKWFEELLAPYGVQGLAERLQATEMRNLRLFGYGIKGFTFSLIESAIELSNGAIPSRDIATIVGWTKEMLVQPIEMLPGVCETIEALRGRYRLMLITKGDLFDQESKIARSGLADAFWRVEIVSEKDEEAYRRLLVRHDVAPDEWLMVGNSVRSDILPAVAVGGRAVHVPYHVTWAHEHGEIGAAVADRVWTIERMDELLGVPALGLGDGRGG
jgi:putative hydrolase of the HAD superfamily